MGLKKFTVISCQLALLFGVVRVSSAKAQTTDSWYMAGANPARTSWVTQAPTGISGISWYRPIEAYIDQKVQIITANGKIYVATSKGLIVLDAENGDLKWRFDTELPLGNSPTVVGDMVYVTGYDRRVYGLRDMGNSYQVVWEFSGANAGYSVNPLVVNNMVYVGSRDGYMYALNAANGALAWQYPAASQAGLSSIMYSAAHADGVLYFAANDMYGYALNATNGALIWKSRDKLPGERYQSWWPVVYGNYVVFSAAPGYKNEANPGTHSVSAGANIKELYRDSFFGSSSGGSGNSSSSTGSGGWPAGLSLLDMESNSTGPTNTLAGYISGNPQRRVYAVLNRSTGTESVYMPFLYTGTYSGNVFPPIVNPVTDALYAKNLFSGTGGNGIARGKLMGWKPGNRYLHQAEAGTWAIDEPQGYSGAGSQAYYNLCCDRAAGVVSGTSWWNYGGTLLEQTLPSQGAANSYDVMWRKYGNALERLNSYYKGNIDTRNGVYQSHGLQNPLIPYTYRNAAGQQVNRIFTHRSNAIIALGTTASKTPLPAVMTNPNPAQVGTTMTTERIRNRLENEIEKMIAGWLNPGYYNDGTIPSFMPVFYFQNPGDGLLTLASAYPHITNSALRTRLQGYLQDYYARYFGTTPVVNLGWTNQARENMEAPVEVAAAKSARPDSTGGAFAVRNFYGLWKYAQVFPNEALAIYNAHSSRLIYPANLTDDTLVRFPYTFNEYIAGYTGFLNLQELAGRSGADGALRERVQAELNSLMARRSQGFAKDHPWQGELDNPSGIAINQYTRQFNLSRNFLHMPRELGNYLRQNNLAAVTQAVNEYTYLGPFWFSGSGDNAFQEGVKTNLYDRPALFAAKAFVLQQSRSELSKYLDVPTFERGDLFYINNLIIALEAPSSGVEPTAAPTVAVSATPVPVPGDANGDGRVDGLDYVAWLTNYGGSGSGDFNNDGRVDGLDYVIWLNNYGL